MKKHGAIIVVLAFGLLLGANKPNPAKLLPPAQSHGMAISKYGCDKQYQQDMPSDAKRTSVWNLTVWAEYGDQHKKYWTKTYGTYQIPVRGTATASSESAGSGAAVGAMSSESFDFTPMNKACSEWGREMESTFKIKPDGSPIAAASSAAKP